MYFQTGQVIFVPEWPKGEFVSILPSFCVWTKSLICKDAANRDSTVQSEVRRISKFLVSRPDTHLSTALSGRCVIPSGRQTVQHLPSGLRASSVRTLHCIEKLLCQLAPSGRFSNTSGRLSVLEQFTDSFQVPRKGRSINSPDDVVYRPDAYLRKARIAVQNESSGHLTAMVRTLVHCIW
jgi:hypothetical protein